MKRSAVLLSLISALFILQSCTKTESDFSVVTAQAITIRASSLTVTPGAVVDFTVFSSVNNENITTSSVIYVNGTALAGRSYNFAQIGTYAVYATKGSITSNVVTINVSTTLTGYYIHNALVEEYSGTWCGNCPRLLYGVDLLHQQTQKAFVVGIHLFGNDPFITSQGNNLAAMRGVGSVPTGSINRTVSWTGPQYQNVPQVINEIKPSSNTGLAISSAVASNNLSISVQIAYKDAVAGSTKLTVYLVEDKLKHTQQNYSSNIFGGLSSIPNFNYDGVLRAVISPLDGDAIPNSGNANKKTYSITLPTNISNIANAMLVAFVTDESGTVLNVQQAKVGDVKDFEKL